jgi:DNA-binding response OmpR family regulator
VPIIALTATPSEEDKAECFGAGMDGFLTKPFTDQQLLQAIQAYVEQEQETRRHDHPLYEFAIALEDSDSDVVPHGRNTVH